MAAAARKKGSVIHHNPGRSTSLKTLQLLRDNGLEPTALEYLKTPPTRARLAALIEGPFVMTANGTRLARPVGAVRDVL